MKNFDGFYDPPDEPELDPWSEEIYDILESAKVDQDVIDKVLKVVIGLADKYVNERDDKLEPEWAQFDPEAQS